MSNLIITDAEVAEVSDDRKAILFAQVHSTDNPSIHSSMRIQMYLDLDREVVETWRITVTNDGENVKEELLLSVPLDATPKETYLDGKKVA
jgi:hypothetical protein